MTAVAHVAVFIASFAAVYVAKLLIWDVGWRDHRVHRTSSTRNTLVVCVAIAAVLVALPMWLGMHLASTGHPFWAILVALGSFTLSGAGFFVISSASGR